ncbi:hypothetical protein Pcinc_024242 [Petrolisthes cinctipes]|uniref:Sec16 Sec23-binding domain-containing protein n=1 Tax=Petrolisthes cinctipes TaxID=88211 RepID=A0AAE1FBY0_PETCI|nr:hypothetical protein Pcinc_024242 [Petrolisthes cinctipes]
MVQLAECEIANTPPPPQQQPPHPPPPLTLPVMQSSQLTSTSYTSVTHSNNPNCNYHPPLPHHHHTPSANGRKHEAYGDSTDSRNGYRDGRGDGRGGTRTKREDSTKVIPPSNRSVRMRREADDVFHPPDRLAFANSDRWSYYADPRVRPDQSFLRDQRDGDGRRRKDRDETRHEGEERRYGEETRRREGRRHGEEERRDAREEMRRGREERGERNTDMEKVKEEVEQEEGGRRKEAEEGVEERRPPRQDPRSDYDREQSRNYGRDGKYDEQERGGDRDRNRDPDHRNREYNRDRERERDYDRDRERDRERPRHRDYRERDRDRDREPRRREPVGEETGYESDHSRMSRRSNVPSGTAAYSTRSLPRRPRADSVTSHTSMASTATTSRPPFPPRPPATPSARSSRGGIDPYSGAMYDQYRLYYQYYQNHPMYKEYYQNWMKHYGPAYGHQPSDATSFCDDRTSIHSGRSSVNDELKKSVSSDEISGVASVADDGVDKVTPQQHRLTPLLFGRPHITAHFTPTGQLILVPPRDPRDGEQAIVQLRDTQKMLVLDPTEAKTVRQMKCFPGPLTLCDTHKYEVVKYCEQRATEAARNPSLHDRESVALLWEYLALLVKQNGRLYGSDIATLLLRGREEGFGRTSGRSSGRNSGRSSPQDGQDDVSVDASQDMAPHDNQGSNVRSSPAPGTLPPGRDETALLGKFNDMLCLGDKNEAVDYAMREGLWGHALALAYKMDSTTHTRVLAAFSASIPRTDVLHTLFQQLSGKKPEVTKSYTYDEWGDWRQHLAMMVSNPTGQPQRDRASLITLGDTLARRGRLHAAHLCYLVAEVALGSYSQKDSKLVLVGSSHSLPFKSFANNEAIQCTEVYEYARALDTTNNPSIHNFQAYKLVYALRLTERSFPAQALRYCEVISEAMVHEPGQHKSEFVSQVLDLATKLKYHDLHYQMGIGEVADMPDPKWLINLQAAYQQAKAQGAAQEPQSATQSTIQPPPSSTTPQHQSHNDQSSCHLQNATIADSTYSQGPESYHNEDYSNQESYHNQPSYHQDSYTQQDPYPNQDPYHIQGQGTGYSLPDVMDGSGQQGGQQQQQQQQQGYDASVGVADSNQVNTTIRKEGEQQQGPDSIPMMQPTSTSTATGYNSYNTGYWAGNTGYQQQQPTDVPSSYLPTTTNSDTPQPSSHPPSPETMGEALQHSPVHAYKQPQPLYHSWDQPGQQPPQEAVDASSGQQMSQHNQSSMQQRTAEEETYWAEITGKKEAHNTNKREDGQERRDVKHDSKAKKVTFKASEPEENQERVGTSPGTSEATRSALPSSHSSTNLTPDPDPHNATTHPHHHHNHPLPCDSPDLPANHPDRVVSLSRLPRTLPPPHFSSSHLRLRIPSNPLVFGGSFPIDAPISARRLGSPSASTPPLLPPVLPRTYQVDTICCCAPNLCDEHARLGRDTEIARAEARLQAMSAAQPSDKCSDTPRPPIQTFSPSPSPSVSPSPTPCTLSPTPCTPTCPPHNKATQHHLSPTHHHSSNHNIPTNYNCSSVLHLDPTHHHHTPSNQHQPCPAQLSSHRSVRTYPVDSSVEGGLVTHDDYDDDDYDYYSHYDLQREEDEEYDEYGGDVYEGDDYDEEEEEEVVDLVEITGDIASPPALLEADGSSQLRHRHPCTHTSTHTSTSTPTHISTSTHTSTSTSTQSQSHSHSQTQIQTSIHTFNPNSSHTQTADQPQFYTQTQTHTHNTTAAVTSASPTVNSNGPLLLPLPQTLPSSSSPSSSSPLLPPPPPLFHPPPTHPHPDQSPKSGSDAPSPDATKPGEEKVEKEGSKGEKEEGGGWFPSIFRWKKSKQAVLPDDKNPSIVWDDEKKKWVSQDGEEEVTAPPPPPPRTLSSGPPHMVRGGPRKMRYVNTEKDGNKTSGMPPINPMLPPMSGNTPPMPGPPLSASPQPFMMPQTLPPQQHHEQQDAPQPQLPTDAQQMRTRYISESSIDLEDDDWPPTRTEGMLNEESGNGNREPVPMMGAPPLPGGPGTPQFFNPAQFAKPSGPGMGSAGGSLSRRGRRGGGYPGKR